MASSRAATSDLMTGNPSGQSLQNAASNQPDPCFPPATTWPLTAARINASAHVLPVRVLRQILAVAGFFFTRPL